MVFFLLSFSDLSHHRTCGSAYGGSLSYVQSDIVVHQTRIACGAEFIIGCGLMHYTFRICPISLAAVAVDSCPRWLYHWMQRGALYLPHLPDIPCCCRCRFLPKMALCHIVSGRFGNLHPLEYVRAGRTKRTKAINFRPFVGVRCGARTHDTQNHNLVLYQLN